MEFLNIVIHIIIILVSLLLVWVNLPGTFLYLFGIGLMGYMNDFEIITKKILIILLIIFVALEIMEFLLATLTVKLYGGKNSSSFLSIIGGIAGGIIGNFFFPIIGGFIGLILGSYFITYYNEKSSGKTEQEAIKIANSTTISYILSKGLKSIALLSVAVYLFLT